MIVCSIGISGGHLNPAVTLGVYIERKKYTKNMLFVLVIIISQVFGALFALIIGFMLRVTISCQNGFDCFEPSVHSFTPPIVISTDGLPATGQVLLAETIGTFCFVLIVLTCKRELALHSKDHSFWVLGMAIGF